MPAIYAFQPPTQYLNFHAQLQEWADKNHVLLEWTLAQVDYVGGEQVHAVYPSIAGNRQSWAVGRARQVKRAKEVSAEMLIKTPGALDAALGLRS